MHGLFMPSASFFNNTASLQKISPSRAKTRMGTIPDSRTLNPFVSFEERVIIKVGCEVHTSFPWFAIKVRDPLREFTSISHLPHFLHPDWFC